MDFEQAAVLRDRLKALTFIQGSQAINAEGLGDADVFALAAKGGAAVHPGFFIRGGQNWGHRSFFPAHVVRRARRGGAGELPDAILRRTCRRRKTDPRRPRTRRDASCSPRRWAKSPSARSRSAVPQRGDRRRLIEQAVRNARRRARPAAGREQRRRPSCCRELAELFDLDDPPQRIEIYDNSHIQGTNALGAMVVAGPEGFIKGAVSQVQHQARRDRCRATISR